MGEEGWISINDRLPTEQDGPVETMYVPCVKRGEKPALWKYIRVFAHFSGTNIDEEEIKIAKIFIEPCFYNERITHWQPLPTFQGRRL